jgi:hypothetical protein
VVAAIYKGPGYGGEEGRIDAAALGRLEARGDRVCQRYMVVLGYAESRKEADGILAKARRAGMPSDVYVTKLRR